MGSLPLANSTVVANWDPGYTCTTYTGADCTHAVTYTGFTQAWQWGTFRRDYYAEGNGPLVSRIFSVDTSPAGTGQNRLTLIGAPHYQITEGETFSDPLYTCQRKWRNGSCVAQISRQCAWYNPQSG